jgi:hypothetical protein
MFAKTVETGRPKLLHLGLRQRSDWKGDGMGLERDEKVDLAGARPVRLGGHEFQVAPLSLRQILAIADYVPKLAAVTVENINAERLMPAAEVVWNGLRRAHPALTRDEFFDLPITIAEMFAALPVVIEQAGGRKVDAAAGELSATGLTPATGASSSPTS